MPEMPLIKILKNRRWERHDYPFPYVYARGVFVDDFYKNMEAEFNVILARGLSDGKIGLDRMTRNMAGYDAYGMPLSFKMEYLSIFLSPEWHDMQANMFPGVKGTGYINAGLHHHLVGSANGEIHTDVNPVWFPTGDIVADGPHTGKGRIRLNDNRIINYQWGNDRIADVNKIQVCRGTVMLFYLANKEWFPGYGGETGMYTSYRDPINRPAKTIPPHNNSLIMYECCPKSFHSFINNSHIERNNVVMWIHRPIEEAMELFGPKAMEYWPREKE